MQHRILGSSGIRVPVLSLGSWQTFEFMDEAAGLDVIAAAIDAGMTFLDDARYDDRTGKAPLQTGYSEVVFGQLLRKGGWPRDRLVIANKLWFEFHPQESIAAELDGSLSRMGLDYLDVLYCAPPGDSLPLAELVRQLHDLVAAGKVRTWGVLNWPAASIEAAYALAKQAGAALPTAAQLPYSLVRRAPVESASMRRACSATQVSIVASASLAGGLLTGKYDRATPPAGARLDATALAELETRGWLEKARKLSELARSLHCTPAQLALAFCLRNEQVCSVLFGATHVRQIEENASALECLDRLDAGALEQLTEIFPS